jgi:hypothetical protein
MISIKIELFKSKGQTSNWTFSLQKLPQSVPSESSLGNAI